MPNHSLRKRTLAGVLTVLGLAVSLGSLVPKTQAAPGNPGSTPPVGTQPQFLVGGAVPVPYRDSDGPGQIQFLPGSFDSATGGRRLTVVLTQGGQQFQGLGFQVILSNSGGIETDLVVFTIQAYGRDYLFRGRLRKSAISYTGFGAFGEAGSGSDLDQWNVG